MRCIRVLFPLLLLVLAACQRDAGDAPLMGPPVRAHDGPSNAAVTPDRASMPAAPAGGEAPVPPTSTVSAARSVQAPTGTSLARYDGYGDLRFGMTSADVAKVWGGELKAVPDAREPCHYLSPKWVKVPADFALMIENDRLVRYDVGTDRETAPGGGRVGMAAAQIERRYAHVEHRPHKYVEGAQVLRIRDPAGGQGVLVFETDLAGKVTAWRAGVPPQVDYVEGCS